MVARSTLSTLAMRSSVRSPQWPIAYLSDQQEAGFAPFGTAFYNPDFSKVAEACGAAGIRIEEPGDVREGDGLRHRDCRTRHAAAVRSSGQPSASTRVKALPAVLV